MLSITHPFIYSDRMSQPYIDLILLSYGKFATTTKLCLASLVDECANENFRLTVIDNCSPDNSANEIREYLKTYPYVRAEYLETNTGFGGGMNYGASLADGEWLLLVNSDTIFAPGALVSLYRALQNQPADVSMVGPITNAAGNDQDYKISGNQGEVLQQAKFVQEFPCQVLIPCYRLDFFCVAIRRSLWQKLHGLDPIFGLGYYEDTDFSMRAKSAGSRMMICEDAFVYHAGGSSFASNPKAKKLIKRNKKIFIHRHPDAVLHHKREGNLAALEEYAILRQQGKWNEGLAIRAKLRAEALLADRPRSPLKNWLWQRKVKRILHKLGNFSIE